MAYVNKLFDTNFMEYASYVIKDRAIPHLIDGLKPVQRRIMHSLIDMDDGKFHKVANVVGHCMQYHPHGDASIYSALVVLANKDFFIDKQGNFGNIYTGDEASAARYIECRLLPLAKQVLYNPDITEFEDSYDGRNKEPVTFPCKIPLILIQGAEGIAVGMATKILPHNYVETLQAVKAVLNEESFILFPDFLTGGLLDVSQYNEGNGKVIVRAKMDMSDNKKIVIREIPFGTTTETLMTSIEDAAKKNKIKIAGINDFTTEKVEIEIKLPRGVHSRDLENSLYAFTDCETSISVNLLVIRDNKPTIMTVSEIIHFHAVHIKKVLKQELELEMGQLKDRLHARTLERIFIEERIYKLIEEMKTQAAVVQAVFTGFEPYSNEIKREVTGDDVDRLLKIPIRRISLYDMAKLKKEMAEINDRLKEIRFHLKNLTDYAITNLDKLIESAGTHHSRKTKLIDINQVDVRDAAVRNLKMKYDKDKGYLGYNISGGKVLFEVSEYDRVLVIKKDATYSIMPVPDKLFIGKGVLYCGLADKDTCDNTVFTCLYKNRENGYPYIKRCQITQFILNKNYELMPKEGEFMKLTTRDDVSVVIEFKQRSLMRNLDDSFPVTKYLIKGVKARGVRLKPKEISKGRFVSSKTLEKNNDQELY